MAIMGNKLSQSDVLDIRRLASRGHSNSRIAEDFDISPTTVYDIVNKRTWGSLPNPKVIYSNYEIYPDGRVWSRSSSNFLSQNSSGNVRLTVKGEKVMKSVNKLVSQYFKQ